MPDDAAVAGNAQQADFAVVRKRRDAAGATRLAAAWRGVVGFLVVTLMTFLYLAAASVIALIVVRVGGDVIDGIDPFLAQDQRPRLFPRQIALRELAVDILRQFALAALVVGVVVWRDRGAWRDTLGLSRRSDQGPRASRLLAILLLWPCLHILWVTGTAEAFAAPFGQHVRLAPGMPRAAVAAWLAYAILLAPVAEEILMRGEIFTKARAAMGPAGAIASTALLFSLAHLSHGGLARPVSLIPLALALGWLRWRTGRLWPCIVLHAWSNLAVLVYVLWPGPG